jgi:hypothetical protein
MHLDVGARYILLAALSEPGISEERIYVQEGTEASRIEAIHINGVLDICRNACTD